MESDNNMHSLFPELDLIAKNTLIIIGNGFDLACGIKSRYCDFRQWLVSKNMNHFIDLMDIFFSNKRDVWGDIEKALGEYDESSILDFCIPNKEIDYDHPTRYVASVEDSPDSVFRPVLDEFVEIFTDWVNDIDITRAKKIRELPTISKYITFNYTETLETIYGIPESNILHIHGSRLSGNDYIVGHNNYRDPDDVYNDDSELYFVQETWGKIIAWMNELLKNTEFIIADNKEYFNSLSEIEQVIVYGHSLYEVDWPYMEEVINQIGKDKPWRISYHEEKDLHQIDAFVKANKLDNVSTFFL